MAMFLDRDDVGIDIQSELRSKVFLSDSEEEDDEEDNHDEGGGNENYEEAEDEDKIFEGFGEKKDGDENDKVNEDEDENEENVECDDIEENILIKLYEKNPYPRKDYLSREFLSGRCYEQFVHE